MHSMAIWNSFVITLVTFVKCEIEIFNPSQLDWHESLNNHKFSPIFEFTEDNNRINGSLYTDYYFNRNHFKLNYEMNYIEKTEENSRRGISTQHPFKKYKMEDVVRCFDSLSIKRQRQPMHIAFMGDSTIRQHFVSFLRLFPDFDIQITTNTNAFAYNHSNMQHHDDRNVTSQLLGNLRISFYWRNLISNELIADFKRWTSNENDLQAPDYIFLGLTAHHILENDFTTFKELLEIYLVPVINQSLAVNTNQIVVWLRLHTAIDQLYTLYGEFYTETITMYNKAIDRIFKNTKIIMWDTISAVIEEYLRACALSGYTRHDFDQVLIDKWMDRGYMNCNDFIHPGMTAISIGTQLIINHMCQTEP